MPIVTRFCGLAMNIIQNIVMKKRHSRHRQRKAGLKTEKWTSHLLKCWPRQTTSRDGDWYTILQYGTTMTAAGVNETSKKSICI